MRKFLLALAVAALAGPVPAGIVAPDTALAQQSKPKDPLELQYEREQRARDDDERAYNATMKRLKAQEGSSGASADPWRNVRPPAKPDARR